MSRGFLWSLIFIVNSPAVLSYDYAIAPHPEEYYCRLFGEDHIFCRFEDHNGIGANCTSYEFLPREFVKTLVGNSFLNNYRNDYAKKNRGHSPPKAFFIPNMNLLVWDDELAAMAERLVYQCPTEMYPFNDVERFKVGQLFVASLHPAHFENINSLFFKMVYDPLLNKRVFHLVQDERETNLISNYNETFPMSLITNPYFKYYGCAFGKVRKYVLEKRQQLLYESLMICNFGPLDLPYAKIQPRGQVCSQCPNGTKCSRKHEFPNLCQNEMETDTTTESITSTTVSSDYELDYKTVTEGGENVTVAENVTTAHLLESREGQSDCFYTCSNGVPHPRCLYNDSSADYEEVVLIDGREVRESILIWHNNIRNLVAAGIQGYPMAGNMREIQWNSRLERTALLWASQCKPYKHGCQDEFLSEDSDFPTPVTQLVSPFIWDETKGLPPYTQPLHSWIQGVKYFHRDKLQRYVTPPKDADYSNFVQVIWANTYMIGCGVVLCHHRLDGTWVNETGEEYTDDLNEGESLLLTVCNYAPGGLIDGKSVFLMGGPCSLCTRLHTNDTGGVYCSKEYISLCSGAAFVPPEFCKWSGILLITLFLK